VYLNPNSNFIIFILFMYLFWMGSVLSLDFGVKYDLQMFNVIYAHENFRFPSFNMGFNT